MRVLALLSGGKDSVCAVETVRGFGWEVVAGLALHPAADDAWMFHTPNLPVVRGVAHCLGLPLLEAPVREGAEEEVEDLQAALAQAHAAFRLDGVVSGALASEYQRTRIELACHRLGLKSFTPLWHKDAAHYVRTMLAGGWDIRFSRTAADGVPNAWAGARLDAAKLDAMRHHSARPHVAGEGGEYETLVLDSPAYGHRLVVDAADVVATASRATWTVQAWHVEPKPALLPSRPS
ncbi:MAG: diphthine-ammonia ligase [Thermoplasmata archaeon]|jgi:ABC transporter with metal-binding/Fe-S-binding domain ATP-binding protein|nr:diphthine-ammonia ligase [Thermoplasmata archaeon]